MSEHVGSTLAMPLCAGAFLEKYEEPIQAAVIAAVGFWRLSMLKETTVRIATVEIERNQLAMEWKAGIDLNWTRASAAL